MDPACSPADLAFLAENLRAEGISVTVEADASRVRLPGGSYARPDGEHGVIGWAEGRDVLWYGRFPSVFELVGHAGRIRRIRALATTGLALVGVWLAHLAIRTTVPGYRELTREMGLLQGVLGLCLLVGGVAWLTARLLRWWATRRKSGVIWVRSPWGKA